MKSYGVNELYNEKMAISVCITKYLKALALDPKTAMPTTGCGRAFA
jgi:hypothetical protein